MSTRRVRGWFFTAWEVETDLLTNEVYWSKVKFVELEMEFLVFQIEKAPDTGKLHAQGVVWFHNPRYMAGVKKVFESETMHLEPCKSQSNAVGYCMKEETRIAGPFTYGVVPAVEGRGHRTDLEDAMEEAEAGNLAMVSGSVMMRYGRGVEKAYQRGNKARYAKTMRDMIEVFVYWGPPGVGKSEWVASQWPDAYWKNCDHKWWDGYEEEEVIILDEFDCQPSYRSLLRLLDKTPLQCEIKGGSIYAAWRCVVITSNSNPKSWYPGEDKAPLWRRITRCTEVRGNTECISTVPSLQDGRWDQIPEVEMYMTANGSMCSRIKVMQWPPIIYEEENDIIDYGDDRDPDDILEPL